MNADGTDPQQLTSGSYDVSPAWSPDGSKIAFASARPNNGSGEVGQIWVMNSDGSNMTQLEQPSDVNNYLADDPHWSPDASQIVFGAGAGGVYVMNADGSNLHQLASSGADPSFSPDGSKIVYSNANNIYVMSADGSNPTPLTSDVVTAAIEPTWSPDGAKIAFAADRSVLDQFQIWTMNADGSDQTALITDGNTREGSPSWQSTSTPLDETSTQLTCAPLSLIAGTAATCTATVVDTGPGPTTTPTGTVEFTSSGAGTFSAGGSCTLSAGSCQLTYTPSSAGSGTHRIIASYEGDVNHLTSSGEEDLAVTPPPESLHVTVGGTGSGTVTSNPAGIDCGAGALACAMTVGQGTTVTLTATAAPGSVFNNSSWIPGCSAGSPPEVNRCTYTVNTDVTIPVFFSLSSPPPGPAGYDTVTVSKAGLGRITSSPAGIACGSVCSYSFSSADYVTLMATPAPGWVFAGWSGGSCDTRPGVCTLQPEAGRQSVTAMFSKAVPRCAWKASSMVPLSGRKKGELSLRLKCTEAANFRLKGRVTMLLKHEKKTRNKALSLGTRGSVTGTAWKTVTVKLPEAALTGLESHIAESASLTLTVSNANGATSSTHAVTRLH